MKMNNPSQPSLRSKGRGLKERNQAFTLVELIVVITILAILGTIAFISLQGYSRDARDSTRTADLGNMKTSLELYSLKTGNFPKPDNFSTITYSGGAVWYQGIVGDQVTTNLKSLNEKPLDPLTNDPYTYSVTQSYGEYEVLALYEGSVVYNQSPYPNPLPLGEGIASIFPQANAATANLTPKIVGNYNGVYVTTTAYIIPTPSIIIAEPLLTGTPLPLTTSNIRSQVITNGTNIPKNTLTQAQTGALTGFKLRAFTGTITKTSSKSKKVEAITQIQQAYSGSSLATQENITYILNQTSTGQIVALTDITLLKGQSNLTSNVNTTPTPPSNPLLGASDINQATCTSANWMWVSSANDVNIGTTKGNGFCISPRYGDWQTNGQDLNDGAGGISWNGWGNYVNTSFQGWNALSISDTGNSYPQYGQTRRLDSSGGYTCKALLTSTTDFITTDDIVGRMKWLATTGNTYAQAQAIEWVQNATPPNGHAIPALYIADCIDGVKDLTTTMIYTQNNDTTSNITYAQYNTDVTVNTDTPSLSNTTYQNRQKYLTAWTQKSGSHLPSAFSYINGGAGGGTANPTSLTGLNRGEYQVACELGLNINGEGSDVTQNELILTSAIGSAIGYNWGRNAWLLGISGCGIKSNNSTGTRGGIISARFIVRP